MGGEDSVDAVFHLRRLAFDGASSRGRHSQPIAPTLWAAFGLVPGQKLLAGSELLKALWFGEKRRADDCHIAFAGCATGNYAWTSGKRYGRSRWRLTYRVACLAQVSRSSWSCKVTRPSS